VRRPPPPRPGFSARAPQSLGTRVRGGEAPAPIGRLDPELSAAPSGPGVAAKRNHAPDHLEHAERPCAGQEPVDTRQNGGPRCSSQYITIMNVRAATPYAVTQFMSVHCRRHLPGASMPPADERVRPQSRIRILALVAARASLPTSRLEKVLPVKQAWALSLEGS